jgi:hypothetical protein
MNWTGVRAGAAPAGAAWFHVSAIVSAIGVVALKSRTVLAPLIGPELVLIAYI